MKLEVIFATGNKHKLEEVKAILNPYGIKVFGLNDFNFGNIEIDENGITYKENALIKANAYKNLTKLPIIADDSGLEINALGNIPGIKSARYAASLGGHQKAMEKILEELHDKKDRSARFVCDIIVLNIEDKPLFFEGVVPGHIDTKINETNGFGYDPIFICDELNRPYSLLTKQEKNTVSHRAKALAKFIDYLINKNIINYL